jgi:hypothetical protein
MTAPAWRWLTGDIPEAATKSAPPGKAAWWLLDAHYTILAGPFKRRGEVEVAGELDDAAWPEVTVHFAAYGVQEADGCFDERESPEVVAMLNTYLEALGRVPSPPGADNSLLSDPPDIDDDYPFRSTVQALVLTLVESGFEIHDCKNAAPHGGVCVIPTDAGVKLSWHQFDCQAKLSLSEERDSDDEIQRVMDSAIYTVVQHVGFTVAEHRRPGKPTVELVVDWR